MKASTPQIILLLSKNYAKSVRRSQLMQSHPLLLACLALVGAAAATNLIVIGFRFGYTLQSFFEIYNPIAFVNDYILALFVSLFTFRFLFQKTPRFNFAAYLHLPISKLSLVHFFQFSSQLTLHNLFPLFFIIPFWNTTVRPVSTSLGATLWLASIVLLLFMSTSLNNWLRATLAHQRKVVSAFALLLVLFIVLDQLAASFWVNNLSRWLFEELITGNTVLFSILALLTVFVFVLSTRSLLRSMRQKSSEGVYDRKLISESSVLKDRGILVELIVTELRLMWRNRRPRHYLVMSVLFSTAYLLFLLANKSSYGGIVFGGIIGLFASGGFALNYGQLMFAWESAYYDGLLSQNISAGTIVKSKYILLQASCLVLFVASLPLFIVLRPDLLVVHLAFLLYNAGITSTLILILALRNRRRVSVERTGNFFNYEGFSAIHWIWIIPTAVPPILALLIFRSNPVIGISIVTGMGLVGLASWNWFMQKLSRQFYNNRHEMAAGFRVI